MSNRKKAKIKPVYDSNFYQYGVYMWEMPDGSFVADEDRNFLNIPSKYGDPERIARLEAAARNLGLEGGQAVFFPGHRRVTDEEYAEQQYRMKSGLIADPYDLPAMVEDIRDNHGR